MIPYLGIYRVCIKGQGLESWIKSAFLTDDPGTNVGIDSRKYEWYIQNC